MARKINYEAEVKKFLEGKSTDFIKKFNEKTEKQKRAAIAQFRHKISKEGEKSGINECLDDLFKAIKKDANKLSISDLDKIYAKIDSIKEKIEEAKKQEKDKLVFEKKEAIEKLQKELEALQR